MTDTTSFHDRLADERIRQASDSIVSPLRSVLEIELRSLVGELAALLSEEHESRLKAAQDAAAAQKDEAVAAALAEKDAAVTNAVAAVQAEAAAALLAAQADASALLAAEKEKAAAAEAGAAEARNASVIEARADERHADLASVDRLLVTIRRIDHSKTLTEVLTVLGDYVQAESGRVAVFLVRNGALRGWRISGFPSDLGEAASIEFPVGEIDVIARAVEGHKCTATSDHTDAAAAAASSRPSNVLRPAGGRAGLAVPICVGGQVVAVLYADEGTADDPPVPSPWPDLTEVAARHASRCLELLLASRVPAPRPEARSVRLAVSSRATEPAIPPPIPRAEEDEESARRYARLLISEIRLYHDAEVTEGRRAHDLLERLRPEIDRARHLYEERIPLSLTSRADWFDQELVRTLADGDAGLLGRKQ